MINVKLFIEDYETNELTTENRNFSSIKDAQHYIREFNDISAYTIIRVSNVYENGIYVGNISQNGRFWLKNSKYGKEFMLEER